jgi:FAD/FMN-containing dehydrogenase
MTRPGITVDIVAALQERLGSGDVFVDGPDVAPFMVDWWGRAAGDALCVVLPRGTGDVAKTVALCHDHSVPIYPQGGNTSVCFGAVPPARSGGIVLSLARMDAVLDVNPRDSAMTVQAGCLLAKAQAAALEVDRLFPLSLGAEGSCQIGGNIATNAGGTGVLRYGNMRDLVLGLEVVLPDGRIWNGLRTLRKDNSGYDLKNLFIGAEGTLGIITAAALKLFPIQPNVVSALIALPEIDGAVTVGTDLGTAFPGELTALELFSASQLRLVARHIANAACPLALDSPWFLLVDIASATSCKVLSERLVDRLAGATDAGLVADAVVAANERQRAALWHIRHSVTEANKTAGMGLSHDIAVPVFAVPSFVCLAGDAIGRAFPTAEIVIVGHLGDGNLHYNVMFGHDAWARVTDQARTRLEVSRILYDLAAQHRGTFSAEHGIGALHLEEMARYKDPVELDLMRTIKRRFDPRNIMNPFRVLPSAGCDKGSHL